MIKSYDDLFVQISQLIQESVPGGTFIAPRHILSSDARSESADTAGMISTIMGDLGEIIEARILSGLAVTASTPPSATVTVALGKGTAGGKLFELASNTEVIIPLDSTTYIYYILLYQNAVIVRRDKPSDHCVIAKIVVPNPGVTARIVDDKPDNGYDGWVVSAKDMFFDQDQEFDDDSREVIRQALSEIAAETIFGTLRASENLIVTNVLGTMKIDSRAMHFYDGEGKELAYYGADYARIGNIKVLYDRIKSQNYSSGISGFEIREDGSVEFRSGIIGGWSITANTLSAQNIIIDSSGSIRTSNFASGFLGTGWQIGSDGSAEFQNIVARGQLSCSAFKKETINAAGGLLIISPASVLDSDLASSSSSITVKDSSFEKNEVIRIKDGANDEWMLVTNSSGAPTYTVTRDWSNDYATNPEWKAGTAVVGMGRTGAGFLSFDSVSANSPFIDVYQRVGTTWNDYSLKARFGNLNGVAGLSGFGLYSENVFLTGTVNATGGTLQDLDIVGTLDLVGGSIRTSSTFPRMTLDQDGLKYQIATLGSKYGSFQYGSGTHYGSGVIAYVLSPTIKVPFYVSVEQTVADLHLFDRASDPTGKAEAGDLAVVDEKLKLCILDGTPGTFSALAFASDVLWEIDGTETQLKTADEIDMRSKKIINVTDPAANQDAATKKYVDDSSHFLTGDWIISSVATAHTGWTNVSATYANKFMRINATPGTIAGADTHTHTVPAHLHAAGTLTVPNHAHDFATSSESVGEANSSGPDIVVGGKIYSNAGGASAARSVLLDNTATDGTITCTGSTANNAEGTSGSGDNVPGYVTVTTFQKD
jgi:hypothetical protein